MSISILARIAIAAAATTFVSTPTSTSAVAAAKPVSVASLSETLPVGYLGAPLGTVVRVTGVAVDAKKYTKAADGEVYLRVERVNGRELRQPIAFEFLRPQRAIKRKPAIGERFDYYVHEHGEFDGLVTPPEKLGIPPHGLAGTGFQYCPYLTLHASNTAQK